jgi:hypothetical protein
MASASPRRRFQFSLRELFAITSMVAVSSWIGFRFDSFAYVRVPSDLVNGGFGRVLFGRGAAVEKMETAARDRARIRFTNKNLGHFRRRKSLAPAARGRG